MKITLSLSMPQVVPIVPLSSNDYDSILGNRTENEKVLTEFLNYPSTEILVGNNTVVTLELGSNTLLSYIEENGLLVFVFQYEVSIDNSHIEELIVWQSRTHKGLARSMLSYFVSKYFVVSCSKEHYERGKNMWQTFIKENYKILFIYIKSSSSLTRIMDLSQLEVVWGEHEDHQNQVIWISKKALK